MIVISNSSTLIALSRIDRLNVLKKLYGHILIPDSVYQETVLETTIIDQKENILKAINDFIEVLTPITHHTFSRNLGKGERGVLDLALEKNPQIILMDDKKARNEARELGFNPFFTTDILKKAEASKIIPSYEDILIKLFKIGIFLPE
jgi:hypothetical protein